MPAVNTLIFSMMLSKLHKLKRVVWIGVHVDAPEYMQMCEVRIGFKVYSCVLESI